jgi:putative ABC transport system permease protein
VVEAEPAVVIGWRGLRSWLERLRGQASSEDVARELGAHLELEAEDQEAAGFSPEESRRLAHLSLGNPVVVAEDVRAAWGFVFLEQLGRDVRYGLRALRRNPGFTTVALLTLALGIGSTTAVFTAFDALVIEPLPFPKAKELVRLFAVRNGTAGGVGPSSPSPPDMRDFEQGSRSFQRMVVYDTWRKNVSFGEGGGDPDQMRVGLVPAAYFEVLGVPPLLGRLFTAAECQEGRNYVAAISAHLWKARFQADPAVLGRTLRINDELYSIVAVMPDAIPEWVEPWGPGLVEVWTPFAFRDAWSEASRGMRGFAALARLKPGVPLEAAQAELSGIATRLSALHPGDRGVGVVLRPLAETRVGALRPMLLLLAGAVGLTLLIACVNLANLLTARNASRQRELALRAALGAGRPGLVRHLLSETLPLALAGAGLGLALAEAGLQWLARLHAKELPQLQGVGLDWRVLAFALLVSLGTNLLFGLAPALGGTRFNLVEGLRQGVRSGTSPGSQRSRLVLVACETAMSLVLLVAAGLLVQSILRLEHQSLGVRQDRLLKGHFYMPGVRYPDPGALTRFCDEFGGRVRGQPGVADATVTTAYPPKNGWTQMLSIPGHPATRVEDVPSAQFGLADAHFLGTLGIPLLRGRNFDETDTATSTPVALVSREFERRYFQGGDPIGQRVHIGPPAFLRIPPGGNISDDRDVTVVGVIGDFRNAGLALPPEPHITVLYSQHPLVNYGFKDIVVRTTADPAVVAHEIRGQLRRLDPDMPFAEVQTIDEVVQAQTGGQRFTAVLLGSFAVAALGLVGVGIYGVVSFLVTQRKRELAVRLAIGASRGDVLRLVLGETLGPAAMGALAGLVGAALVQRLTRDLLFETSPVDPLTFLGALAFLLGLAALASVVPAARVLRIDPARTLGQD